MIMLTTSDRKTIAAIFSKMEREDFAIVADMYKQAQSICTRLEASAFQVGDSVYFNDKRGTRVTGTITKINRKTIKVDTNGYLWSVSPSLLKAA